MNSSQLRKKSTTGFLKALIPVCLLASSPLLMASCDEGSPGTHHDSADDVYSMLRLELSQGQGAVGSIVIKSESISYHRSGGWASEESSSDSIVEPGATTLVHHGMVAGKNIKIIRIGGEFTLRLDDGSEETIQMPTRGLQIQLEEALVSNAVNHVTVDLSESLKISSGSGKVKLGPVVSGIVTAVPGSFETASVTHANGGQILLDDGFELVIPPGVASETFVAWAARVEGAEQTYYQLGPEGTQFSGDVTVHVPDIVGPAQVGWDAEVISGSYDEQGRVEAKNDHFCCVCEFEEGDPEKINDATYLYEGVVCDTPYSLMYFDLNNPRLFASVNVADPSDKTGDNCTGQTVFDVTRARLV